MSKSRFNAEHVVFSEIPRFSPTAAWTESTLPGMGATTGRHFRDKLAMRVKADEAGIAELAELVRRTVGYEGRLTFNTERPDGVPRKLLDITRLKKLGWQPRISLADGLADAYRWFLDNVAEAA